MVTWPDPTAKRSARAPLRAARLALAFVGVVACGGSDDVSLDAVYVQGPRELAFSTSCAEDVSVEVEETTTEVRISDVTGAAIDGDCLGSLDVQLEAPLEGRTVVVNGERWVDLKPTCPLGSIGPPDLTKDEPMC